MTVDTRVYVTVTRTDIAAVWPVRQLNQRYTLQTVYGEACPILMAIFLTPTLGRRSIQILVLIANIVNEFILGLDILRAYDASMDL
jgi:hypothetical protein